jgi:predicted Fe-Mo cluster-binding NifX family protein
MSGTALALAAIVTVAIPICQERISPVLDTATRLLVVTRLRGREVRRKEITLNPQPLETLAASVAELGVKVLLCAALSEPLQRALAQHGVRVRNHLCGEVEEVLAAFCRRRLTEGEFRMPGCWGNHFHGHCCRPRWARSPIHDFTHKLVFPKP